MNEERKIGLVLVNTPQYSETFLRSKIKGLEADGNKVSIFTTKFGKNDSNYDVRSPLRFSLKNGLLSLKDILKFLYLLTSHLKVFIEFYKLEKSIGRSTIQITKGGFLNAHILSAKLDWLHFGFGMLAINRENLAKSIGAKMAVSFRGADLYLSPLKHPNCYDVLIKQEVKYHVLSREMFDTLISKNIDSKQIDIITPAIDIDFFTSNNKLSDNKSIQILTVARLHWKKGLIYTLEAIALAKERGLNFSYKIVGEGPLKEELLFAIYQLGLEEEVILNGQLNKEEVRDEMSRCDMYLQYSVQEGFSNATLEAQAMGMLCVVSDADGLAENIIHNKTGWVVPKRQPALLAKKIIEVANLKLERKMQIQETAMNRVKEEFNLNKQKKEFSLFYEK